MEIPADMLLFQICIPFAIEHFKMRTTIKSLLHYWFTAAGWALGLTDFLLSKLDDNGSLENGNGEPARQERLQILQAGVNNQGMVAFADDDVNKVITTSGESNNAGDDYDNDEQSDSDYAFVLHIVLLLVIAWMTLLIFNSALIVVPISLGRALFNAIPYLPITHGIKCNDLAFIIGSYVIWTAVAGARYSIEQIRKRTALVLLSQIWKWYSIVVKSFALLSIWIFVIPMLIGLLFELLVIVPMRVPVDESPIFLLYQDWALGLIFLKIWNRLVCIVGVLADEAKKKTKAVEDIWCPVWDEEFDLISFEHSRAGFAEDRKLKKIICIKRMSLLGKHVYQSQSSDLGSDRSFMTKKVGHGLSEPKVLVDKTFLFKVEIRSSSLTQFESSYSVKKICDNPIVMGKFIVKFPKEDPIDHGTHEKDSGALIPPKSIPMILLRLFLNVFPREILMMLQI